MKKIILIMIAGMILYGCTNMAPEMPPEAECTPQFPDMDVTYDNYVRGILVRYCIECHQGGNSPGPGNFTTYNGIQPYTGDLFYYRVISDNADMPQGNAPLPESIRDSLNVWIRNCAPEN
ncbi:MAG: hypothetical protein AB2L24_11365 [Mangrovibacterium sp.]